MSSKFEKQMISARRAELITGAHTFPSNDLPTGIIPTGNGTITCQLEKNTSNVDITVVAGCLYPLRVKSVTAPSQTFIALFNS